MTDLRLAARLSERKPETRRAPRSLVTAVGVALLLFPFNNADVSVLTISMIALSVVAMIVASIMLRDRLMAVVIITAAVLSLISMLSRGMESAVGVATLVSMFGVGVAIIRAGVVAPVLVISASAVGASLAAEAAGISLTGLLGITWRVDYPLGVGGARLAGLFGHPLLTAYVMLFIGLGLVRLMWQKRPHISVGVFALVTVPASILTGTRSALAIGVGVAVVLTFAALLRGGSLVQRGSMAVATLVTIASATWALTSSVLDGSRVLNFDSIFGESSYTVRAGVFETLERAATDWSCSDLCLIFGRGFRASTEYFSGREQALFVRTFDNTFVTIWFDFQAIGLACILIVMLLLFQRRGRSSTVVLVTALAFVAGGALFDSLYVPNVAFLASVLWLVGSTSTKSAADAGSL